MKLTDEDLKAIKDLIEVTFDDKFDEKIKKHLSYLPSKDDFYEETSKILKKIEDLETEKTVLGEQVSRNSDRIDKVEASLQS